MLVLISLLYFTFIVVVIFKYSHTYQWDFRSSYYAAKIFASGQNPYDANIVSKAAQPLPQLYTYPPVTLYFYRIFSSFEYKTAYYVFLFLKCIALMGLLYLWRKKYFERSQEIPEAFFYIFCLLAFSSAVKLDMNAGNINLFEQCMLWLGFSYYLKRRFFLFTIIILVAASFKILPALFLLLLCLSDDKNNILYLSIASILFLFYLLINYLVAPHLFIGFLKNALAVCNERGIINASTFNFVKDLAIVLQDKTGFILSNEVIWLSYFSIITIIVFSTCYAYRRLFTKKIIEKEKMELFLFCLIYALILPRFKDYAYVLLLIPTDYILKKKNFIKVYPVLFVLTVFPSYQFLLLTNTGVSALLHQYYSLILAYGVWSLYLYYIFSLGKSFTASNVDHYV